MVANFVEIIQNQVLMSKKTLTLTAVAAVIIIGAAFIFAGKSGREDSRASALTSEQKYCNTVCVEGDSEEEIIRKAANVIPSENQFQALENEFIAFVHFGPNTFTGKEWEQRHGDPGDVRAERTRYGPMVPGDEGRRYEDGDFHGQAS